MKRTAIWFTLMGVVAGCGAEDVIALEITSWAPADQFELRLRTIDGRTDVTSYTLDGVDLTTSPYLVSIGPSDIVRVDEEFLVHARGFSNQLVVSAASRLLTLRENQRIAETLVMTNIVAN